MKTFLIIASTFLLPACSVFSSGPVGALVDTDLAKAKQIADATGDKMASDCYSAMIQNRLVTAGAIGLFSTIEATRSQKAVAAACAGMLLP